MKNILIFLAVLGSTNAFSAPVWKSTFTDLKNDCVVISSATEEAPIDFYKAECKSFAGFSLFIEGGDIRYSPELVFGDTVIDLQRPPAFHDMASDKVEWLYTHEIDNEGSGAISWKGMIYQLSVASVDGESNITVYYSVHLDGAKSCLVGTSETDSAAHDLVKNSKCEITPLK